MSTGKWWNCWVKSSGWIRLEVWLTGLVPSGVPYSRLYVFLFFEKTDIGWASKCRYITRQRQALRLRFPFIKPSNALLPKPTHRQWMAVSTHTVCPKSGSSAAGIIEHFLAPSHGYYRGADKSLSRPGRKQSNVSVRVAWISFGALPCRKKKLDDISRLDVVEIARVPDMLPSLFPSWSG